MYSAFSRTEDFLAASDRCVPETLIEKNSEKRVMKYWEIIADNPNKAGWSWGCVSSTDQKGRQFWVAAAEREDAGRFIVRADEKLTAFSTTKVP